MANHEKFPIDAAQIVGLFMEITFVHCLRILLWIDGHLKPVRDLHWKMVIAAVAMFVIASLDVAFHVRHNLDAFVYYEGDPVEEFSKTSNWINVMKMGCFVAQTFVGDAILLYRCWIIYDRRWLVIATSTVLWLGCTVCGVVTVYVEATHDTTGHLLKASTLVPFMASMLCLTLVTNVLTTGLIVRRILRVQRKLPVHRSVVIVQDSPLTRAAVVMIESGLIYTVSMVVLVVLYMAGNNGMYGVSNAVVQIIGITFNLIITSADRRQESSGGQGSSILTQNGTGLGLHRITIQTTVSRYPPDPDVDTFKYPGASPDAESVRIPTSAHRKSEWIQDGSEP
ncbi:hypothetical protein D9611_010377 [Ephemerocybe angulata]|uniref:Uncharacterized protein n=1 Tax=Ephemerocybe angulata TaxID=980116 RepID=A0A8H5F1A6_9AGAR|nr:hypothetical protein D9611_010377 [Tulosesus angulatus]